MFQGVRSLSSGNTSLNLAKKSLMFIFEITINTFHAKLQRLRKGANNFPRWRGWREAPGVDKSDKVLSDINHFCIDRLVCIVKMYLHLLCTFNKSPSWMYWLRNRTCLPSAPSASYFLKKQNFSLFIISATKIAGPTTTCLLLREPPQVMDVYGEKHQRKAGCHL